MSAAVASTASAYTQIFGSPSIDARLNLSLDDLIKERKKEIKKELQQKKRESVKQEQTSQTKKTDAKQQQKMHVANAQADKRQAKMNKNRGLPVAQSNKKKQENKENDSTNAKPSKKQRKKTKLAAAATTGRQVTSPKAKPSPKNGNHSPKQKTKKELQQPKQKTPVLSPKQHTKEKMTFVTKASKTTGREVNKTTKSKNLQITLVRSKSDVRRTKKVEKKKQQSTVVHSTKSKLKGKAAKALLPGKSQPKTRKVLAQTIVKKAKTASRKQWTSKNGKFIVRKRVMVRKA